MNVLTSPAKYVFLRYSLLSVLGMLAISSAGIVDGYFIGNYVGSKGLAAINITMPLFSLLFGIALAFGIGGSVMSGKKLATGNKAQASVIFTKTILTIALISLFFSGTLFLYMPFILKKMGANQTLLPYAISYLGTMILFFPFLMVGIVLDYFARADSRPGLAFAGLAISAGVNIVLDWYFVAKLGWGLKGAAFATGISFVSLVITVLPHFLKKKGNLRFTTYWKHSQSVARVAINGVSEFINESSIGITTLLFNLAMLRYFDTEGVAAFSVITYWLWIGQMGMFGICDALGPLISKNYGAKQFLRVKKFLKLGISSVIGIGFFMIVFLLLTPEPLATLFLKEDSAEALEIALSFGLFIWPVFLFNGTNLVISAYFTALQHPRQSTLIALSRSLFFPAFFIYFLPFFLGSSGVFLALPISELLAFFIALSLMKRFKY